MTRWKTTHAERMEARRLSAERVAVMNDFLSTHQCDAKRAPSCPICRGADAARWAERAQRAGPRRATRIDFRVSDVVKNLTY